MAAMTTPARRSSDQPILSENINNMLAIDKSCGHSVSLMASVHLPVKRLEVRLKDL